MYSTANSDSFTLVDAFGERWQLFGDAQVSDTGSMVFDGNDYLIGDFKIDEEEGWRTSIDFQFDSLSEPMFLASTADSFGFGLAYNIPPTQSRPSGFLNKFSYRFDFGAPVYGYDVYRGGEKDDFEVGIEYRLELIYAPNAGYYVFIDNNLDAFINDRRSILPSEDILLGDYTEPNSTGFDFKGEVFDVSSENIDLSSLFDSTEVFDKDWTIVGDAQVNGSNSVILDGGSFLETEFDVDSDHDWEISIDFQFNSLDDAMFLASTADSFGFGLAYNMPPTASIPSGFLDKFSYRFDFGAPVYGYEVYQAGAKNNFEVGVEYNLTLTYDDDRGYSVYIDDELDAFINDTRAILPSDDLFLGTYTNLEERFRDFQGEIFDVSFRNYVSEVDKLKIPYEEVLYLGDRDITKMGTEKSEVFVSRTGDGKTAFEGREGDDTYLYSKGDLNLFIFDNALSTNDRLVISGISSEDIRFRGRTGIGSDVVIDINKGNNDPVDDRTIILGGMFADDQLGRIEEVIIADETLTYTFAEIFEAAFGIEYSEPGSSTNPFVNDLQGQYDHVVYQKEGDASKRGGNERDLFIGLSGDGSTAFQGDGGDDIYLFQNGDQNLYLFDNATSSNDQLILAGLANEDLAFRLRPGHESDVVIDINKHNADVSDDRTIIIGGIFADDSLGQIEQIVVNDEGMTYTSDDIYQLVTGDNLDDSNNFEAFTQKFRETLGSRGISDVSFNTFSGTNASDSIYGSAGYDVLTGFTPSGTNNGVGQIDQFITGASSDLVVLGDASQPFYVDANPNTAGLSDHALIIGFESQNDYLLLHGMSSQYTIGSAPSGFEAGTAIYWAAGQNESDLVAFLPGIDSSSLESALTYIS